MESLFAPDQRDHGLCSALNTTRALRPSCHFTTVDLGRLDTVVGIRLVATLLSLLGSVTILISSLVKRRVLKSEVHPIFMIALADCMLAVQWIAGASLWLSKPETYSHTWCYAITLMTAILECVSINLTVAYALFAYVNFQKVELGSFMWNQVKNEVNGKLSVVVYAVSWLAPTVIIMTVFGFVIGLSDLIPDTKSCSCWCIPTIVNIIPLARASTNQTREFVGKQLGFLIGLWSFILINYIIVFSTLLVLYFKMLRKIRIFRDNYESDLVSIHDTYGARVIRGQYQARKRVILFITVFIISGSFNAILTLILVIVSFPVTLYRNFGPPLDPYQTVNSAGWFIYLSLLYAQSVTLPLQGFLNAIVYGWTREDFVNALHLTTQHVVESAPPCDEILANDDYSGDDDLSQSLTTSYIEEHGRSNRHSGVYSATLSHNSNLNNNNNKSYCI